MAEQDTPRNPDRDTHPERQYDEREAGNAGGITNRPLSDEIENQETLPERGTRRNEAEETDPALPAGDATLNTKI